MRITYIVEIEDEIPRIQSTKIINFTRFEQGLLLDTFMILCLQACSKYVDNLKIVCNNSKQSTKKSLILERVLASTPCIGLFQKI